MNRMTQAGHLYQIIGGATPTDRELAAVPGLASHEPTPPGSDGAVITALPQAHWRPGAKLFLVENGSDGDIDAAETMETRIRKALTAAQLVKHNIFTKGVHYADTGVVAVSGTAKLFATGDCVVYATGQAEVIASGEVRVFACDRVTGSCRISVKLEAGGNSVFHIYGHSTAKASESAHVIG
ncbi:MAG TPA: hypothetical protein V6C72_06260, partial [Chroococcales cyanobacterium]